MSEVITYLDHAATTPLRAEVAEAMAGLRVPLGNPTGSHRPAQRARRLLEEARDEVAERLGRQPREIIFTSGGTESANLAVFGAVWPEMRAGGTARCAVLRRRAPGGASVLPGRGVGGRKVRRAPG